MKKADVPEYRFYKETDHMIVTLPLHADCFLLLYDGTEQALPNCSKIIIKHWKTSLEVPVLEK